MPVNFLHRSLAVCVVLSTGYLPSAGAEAPIFNAGAKIALGGWNVADNDGNARTVGNGSLLNLQMALHWSKAYVGTGLSGGKFNFNTRAPRRPTSTAPSQSGRLQRGEFDAVLGYYFWEQVALFTALKTTAAKWDDGYTLDTAGLGVGVSAQHTLAPRWSLLWHLGLMSLDAGHAKEKIGSGSATTLEFTGVYHLNASTGLRFGLKLQGQTLQFDNGVRQEHNFNTLGVGINHAF